MENLPFQDSGEFQMQTLIYLLFIDNILQEFVV